MKLLYSLAFFAAVSCSISAVSAFELSNEQTNSPEEINATWEIGQSGEFAGKQHAGGKHSADKDVTIAYMKFEHPEPIGSIFISSGRTESYIKYKETIHDLYRNGYSVYIHDHRGQGFSDRLIDNIHMGHVGHFGDFVSDLKTFYDMQVADGLEGNIFLLGHSMGGAIATRYIQEYPTDFNAAALSAPMHHPEIPKVWEFVGCAIVDFQTVIESAPEYASSEGGPYVRSSGEDSQLTHSEQRYNAYHDTLSPYNIDLGGNEIHIGGPSKQWVARACEVSETIGDNVDKIQIPVLVFQAEEDKFVTADAQNGFCQELAKVRPDGCASVEAVVEAESVLAGGASTPIVVEGAYHELLIELDRYRLPVMKSILTFFEQNQSGE